MWKRSWTLTEVERALPPTVDVINPAVDGGRLSRGEAMQCTKEAVTNSTSVIAPLQERSPTLSSAGLS